MKTILICAIVSAIVAYGVALALTIYTCLRLEKMAQDQGDEIISRLRQKPDQNQ